MKMCKCLDSATSSIFIGYLQEPIYKNLRGKVVKLLLHVHDAVGLNPSHDIRFTSAFLWRSLGILYRITEYRVYESDAPGRKLAALLRDQVHQGKSEDQCSDLLSCNHL